MPVGKLVYVDDVESRIRSRYFRKTTENPEGAVVHFGDCEIFSLKICTCGLLHDITPYPLIGGELYPKVFEEWKAQEDVRYAFRMSQIKKWHREKKKPKKNK